MGLHNSSPSFTPLLNLHHHHLPLFLQTSENQNQNQIMTTNNNNKNKNKKAAKKKEEEKVEDEIYEGDRLARFLNAIQKQVRPAAQLSSLPDKFWYKQQFAVGVNEVTRALERMPLASGGFPDSHRLPPRGTSAASRRQPTPVKLQAVLVAWDCNPKWLTKHIPGLASSRKVPVVFVKDNKGGSLRLGELVKLRTAIAVGVKDRGSSINQAIAELLGDSGIPVIEPETAAS